MSGQLECRRCRRHCASATPDHAPPGPLRHGVLTIGLASGEIASVATTVVAGGRAAPASVMLIGSTVLAVVVVAPLALGILLRATRNIGEHHERLISNTATVAVDALIALIALIASEVHLSTDHLGVAAAFGAAAAASSASTASSSSSWNRPSPASSAETTRRRPHPHRS